jgi:hypothetical protein
MDDNMFENDEREYIDEDAIIDNSIVVDYSQRPKNSRKNNKIGRKNNKTILIVVISIIAVMLIIGLIFLGIYNNGLSPVSKKGEGKDIKLLVEKGDTVKGIAKLLKEKGAIKDENIFNLYTKITGKSSFKQGRYKFNTENDVKTIVEKLVKGDVNKEEIKLQLLEGKTMTDLAEVVEKVTVNTKEQFLNKMKDKEYIKKLSEKYWFIDYDTVTNKDIYYPLEGYLFPDTYIFDNKEVGIETIIDTMLKHTEKKLVDYKNITDKKKLTIHEVLTLASIIELEAGTSKTKSEEKTLTDREIVAKIFMNRINKKMSLRK